MERPEPFSDAHAVARIGSDLLRARGRLGWSQRDLESVSGIDQTTISRLERGLLPNTRLRTVARLIVALRAGVGPRMPPS